MDNKGKFLQAFDNSRDYADYLIDGLKNQAREDIDDLLRSAENRDAELWGIDSVEYDATLEELDSTEPEERDMDWMLLLAALIAFSANQVFLENRRETIIKPLAYHRQKLDAINLSKADAISAGKRKFDFVTQEFFDVLQQKHLSKFEYLKNLSNRELYETLRENGAIRIVDKSVAEAQGHVSRLTEFRPGSPQFREAVSDIIDVSADRNMKKMSRRAIEALNLTVETGGNRKQLLVWIVEGGPNTCEWCLARAGTVGTYEYFVEIGLPGSDVCKGGDLCRCSLIAI